ncbi:MAG: Peptidoglycan DL-endopeptidase CwlO [Candidatus Collierbacteria bacterium GW2011_GWA1_42_60]|nr:MAG: Peptidoglycan DL-endopeptidase CwlO [Candidatus Collierbacteria bacterium GW2011_GWA1_42_60]
MKKLLLVFVILLLFLWIEPTNAIDCDGSAESVDACTQKINELRNEETTLSQAISVLNAKINLAQARINQTQVQINALEKEITVLDGVLETVNDSMDQLEVIYTARVRESYKQMRATPVDLIFSSNSRVDYDQRKDAKVEKQQEVEKLKATLVSQRKTLDAQQKEKQKILAATQSDEAKYQQLLSQALAEKAAIEKALVSSVKVGPIKKGEPIALTGNSGYPSCSTGKHLHFEIRKNGTWTDPGAYLSSKSVKDEQNGGGNVTVGTGSWPWPLNDTVRLTQFYGSTPYSWRYKYSGGVHTGYDMVSTSSDVIYAPADGTLYKSSQSCGTSTINIVYIEHADSVVSFYLHVQ